MCCYCGEDCECRPLWFLLGLFFAFLALPISLFGVVVWLFGLVLACICPYCLCVTVVVELALELIKAPNLIIKWFTSNIPYDTEAGQHKERSSDSAATPGGDWQQESEPNNKQSLQVTTAPLVYTEARRQEEVSNVIAASPNGDAQQVPVPSPHARTAPLDQDAAEKVPKQRKNSVSTDTVLAPGKPEPALAAPSTSGGETKLTGIQKLASVNLKSYKYEDLAKSTGGFSHSNHLGDGGFGEVYKGTLADGEIAAIKKLKYQAGQKEEEFVAEISTINRVHHKHLVKLLGYCDDDSNRVLVYEYVPNNSLRSHLHGKDKPILSWCNRIKIAIGSAKGLEYLHQYCNPKIIHRDIKADNILLDDNFEPKIADFGLARDCSYSVTHISTDPKGTFGYLAPEYAKDRKLTDKSDVFSFGVVLLELITGRKSVFFEGKDAHNLAVWMMPHIEKALESGNYDELVDPKLEKKDTDENELARMTYCAAACVYKLARDRPHMSQIVEALQGNISLDRIWISGDNKFFYDSSGKRRELYGISEL